MRSQLADVLSAESSALHVRLSDDEIRDFEVYASEIVKWNKKINLTAITDEKEIAIKHIIDSLALAPHIGTHERLLDIGSGAGFPVIPLKIVNSEAEMVSVDAVAKKIHFQRHIIRMLHLHKIEAIHSRIELLRSTHSGYFSVITSRAFASLGRFVSLAAPLLADGGVIIAMKGDHAEDEILAHDDEVAAEGFVVSSVQPYSLPGDMGGRALTFLKRR